MYHVQSPIHTHKYKVKFRGYLYFQNEGLFVSAPLLTNFMMFKM